MLLAVGVVGWIRDAVWFVFVYGKVCALRSRSLSRPFFRCTRGKPEVMSLGNCESEVVDVNLNDIDDKEFDIPPIDQQPTLDSILSLPDDEQSLVDSEVSFAAEFPLPGHAPFVHPVGVFAISWLLLAWFLVCSWLLSLLLSVSPHHTTRIRVQSCGVHYPNMYHIEIFSTQYS